jgi:hypothetical protein
MASSGDTSRAPSDHAPRSAPADVSARTPGIARRVLGLPRPILFGRRIRARFVLASCVAVVLAGMLGATMFKWTVVFPGAFEWTTPPPPPGGIDGTVCVVRVRIGGAVCNGETLALVWEDHRPSTSRSEPCPGEPFPKEVAAGLVESLARKHTPETWHCSLQKAGMGWRLRVNCRLWLARTVLGAGCVLFGWLAWWMRPRWRVGHCQNCGYDLAGLAGKGMCPECGPQPASGIAS